MFTLLSLCVGIVARKTLRLHLRFRSATLFICWKPPSRMRTALSAIPNRSDRELLRQRARTAMGSRRREKNDADSAANGGDLTLTDPVWRNATCDDDLFWIRKHRHVFDPRW
jgi:hypothetical protein